MKETENSTPINRDSRIFVLFQKYQKDIAAYFAAPYFNNEDCLDLLILKHLSKHENEKQELLFSAAANGRTKIVEALIDKGATIDFQNNYGWTALMFATYMVVTTFRLCKLIRTNVKQITITLAVFPISSVRRNK